MIYKNFTIQIIMRHVFIFVNMIVIIYPLLKYPIQNIFFITILLSIVLIIQFYLLFKYLRQSHELLNEAVKMLNAGQYAIQTSSNTGFKSIDDLSFGLNKAVDSFKKLNNRYQSQLNYLELLIEKIDVGILSINKNNKIELVNSACKQILGIEKLKFLEDINGFYPLLAETIEKSDYSRHLLMELKNGDSIKQVSLKINSINILGKMQKLVSIHNISGEIIKTETEAWSRLLKILNHEIFNSVTPLSSLSSTLNMIIKTDEGIVKTADELSNEEIEDIAESIEIINVRSSNLMNFIDGFKKLAKVPPPKIIKLKASDLLNQTVLLFKDEAEKKKIKISINSESDFEINVDQSQIEQAIINLISNSMHALAAKNNRKIELRTFIKGDNKCIQIWDNGQGIPEENMDRIFIPFFSTRKNGSGIGLSLTKYLIQLNNGNIEVSSKLERETKFTLIFD